MRIYGFLFFFFFLNLVLGIWSYFLGKTLLHIHLCLESWVNRIYYFFIYLYEHSCLHWWSECCVWECVRQGKIAHYRRWGCLFNTGIRETVAWDDCCAGVAIKCSTHHSWIFSMPFSDFKPQGVRSITKPPMVNFSEFFHADGDTNVNPLPDS